MQHLHIVFIWFYTTEYSITFRKQVNLLNWSKISHTLLIHKCRTLGLHFNYSKKSVLGIKNSCTVRSKIFCLIWKDFQCFVQGWRRRLQFTTILVFQHNKCLNTEVLCYQISPHNGNFY